MIEPGKNGHRSGSVAKGRCEAGCFAKNGRPLVFCRKHKARSGGFMRFPDQRLWKHHGLTRLGLTTRNLPWAKA